MKRSGDLTAPMERLVAALMLGPGHREAGSWAVNAVPDVKFARQTVEAAYDRCLVKITVESRHRRRHKLELTEIGEAVARGLLPKAPSISPEASILIQEIMEAR
jgi:hypothetical protein